MIVPQTRLLLWVGVIVLPFAAVAAMEPEAATLAGLLIVAVLMLAALDAALAYGAFDGISVELPTPARLSMGRAGQIELRIKNERQQTKWLRLGLALPREFHSPGDDVVVLLPAGAPVSKLAWCCTPLKRGNYSLDSCYLETVSPWGFWAVRAKKPVHAEIRVYPNLLTERNSVATLFLNRGNFGAHSLRQVGKGRDFEKLREYMPGDSFEDVYWKATAKRGRPVTKIFQIERTQEVYVIIDASRLSSRRSTPSSSQERNPASSLPAKSPSGGGDGGGFGSEQTGNRAGLHSADERGARNPDRETSQSLLERFITAGLILGLAAEQQGDLFGLLTFSDKIQKFVRAKNGKAHYSACRDALYTLQPQIVTPDFDELSSFIRMRLRRRALLVFLTSLDDPVLAESFVRNLDLICRQHLILVNMLQPPGARPVFSDARVSSLDEIYRQLGGHVLWHNLRELEKVLKRRGVRLALLDNEKLSAQLVAQYLNVKRRQLL